MTIRDLIKAGTVAAATPPTGYWLTATNFFTGSYNLSSNVPMSIGVGADSTGNVYQMWYSSYSGGMVVWIKTDANGVLLNQAIFPSYYCKCACVDSSGNTYLVGTQGNSYFQVMKISSSGTITWSYQYLTPGGANGITPYSLCTDSSGNIFITGYFNLTSYSNYIDGFLIKLNSSGTVQWSNKMDTSASGQEYGASVAADATYVYILARTGIRQNSTLMRFTQAGSLSNAWYSSLANSGGDNGGLAVDASGNIYWSVSRAIFAKMNSSGTIQWTVNSSSSIYNQNLISACVDATGNTYTYENGTIDDRSMNIVKRDTAGNRLWSKALYAVSNSSANYCSTPLTYNTNIAINPANSGLLIQQAFNYSGLYGTVLCARADGSLVGSVPNVFFSNLTADTASTSTTTATSITVGTITLTQQAGTTTTATPTYTVTTTVL